MVAFFLKYEILELHRVLFDVARLLNLDLSDYEDLGVYPTHIHKHTDEHIDAILLLARKVVERFKHYAITHDVLRELYLKGYKGVCVVCPKCKRVLTVVDSNRFDVVYELCDKCKRLLIYD